ncbi:histidine kinase [Kitasatospora nipponensis]|uniref:histidine kinase n=1 Tax=Kitasatospora nipponensis TaxID=258049 RepID=A0ABN1VSW4_9ACTN
MSVIGHLRRVVRRHEHLADATIALAVFAATAVTTFAGHPAPAMSNRTVALIAAVLGCGVLAGRRLHPLVALGVSAVAAELFLAQTGGSRGALILLAPSIALYTVADLVERRRGLFVAGAALGALALAHVVVHNPGMFGPQNLAFTALGGLAIAAGDSARNRRAYLAEVEQRAERAELEREQDARGRIAEERLRIARDLHDSVGHHLAVIGVQSDVAGLAVHADPAAAREALAHVKSASRKALGELRDTVSLLRQPGEDIAPTTTPAPGLDGLDELLVSMRAAGLDIDLRTDGAAQPLAPAADLTAYRVIQESLTNAYKHSRRRQARLTLAYHRDGLLITVDDLGGTSTASGATVDGRTLGNASLPSGQHGIVGMRERVLALGGTITTRPRPDGAFQVAAALPYQTLDLTPEPHQ